MNYQNAQGQVKEIDDTLYTAWVLTGNAKADHWKPRTVATPPAYDPATQRISALDPVFASNAWAVGWQVIALTQSELDAIAAATETQAIREFLPTLNADKAEADADLAEVQAYIDLAAPTNAERNAEVLNSAKRDKRRYQREKRQLRVLSKLIKLL